MAQITIRKVDDRVAARLKKRAKKNKRSLQAEVLDIIERAAAAPDIDEMRVIADRIRQALSGRRHSDSAKLLAEDRRR